MDVPSGEEISKKSKKRIYFIRFETRLTTIVVLKDVLTASNALKDGGSNPSSRRHSREALSVAGLDVPVIKTR